jgi:hypothetical protein
VTPYERAEKWYAQELPERSLAVDVFHHIHHGNVLVTATTLALVRGVPRGADEDEISDPACWWEEQETDCWFCWLLVGSLRETLSHLPYRKPWVAYGRKGSLRFWSLAALMARTKSISNGNTREPSAGASAEVGARPVGRGREGAQTIQAATA